MGDVTISRDETWKIARPLNLEDAKRGYNGFYGSPDILLCREPGQVANHDLWLDLVDASPFMGGDIELLKARHRDVSLKILSSHSQNLGTEKLELPGDLWSVADRELALAWWAMREALKSAPDYTMHDGTGMLALGHRCKPPLAWRAAASNGTGTRG